jgi:ABC-type thiamine transport system ATPase subunit
VQALARAVYSRKPILLLDDPFSALDKTTRDLILIRLFGASGLLRKLGTTVIYTTHDGKHSPGSCYGRLLNEPQNDLKAQQTVCLRWTWKGL